MQLEFNNDVYVSISDVFELDELVRKYKCPNVINSREGDSENLDMTVVAELISIDLNNHNNFIPTNIQIYSSSPQAKHRMACYLKFRNTKPKKSKNCTFFNWPVGSYNNIDIEVAVNY